MIPLLILILVAICSRSFRAIIAFAWETFGVLVLIILIALAFSS